MAQARSASDTDRAMLAALLAAVAREDRRALERLYLCTSAKLFGVCLRILDDRATAEEALQDVYLNVWRRAGSYDTGRGTAMTWLLTLSRNAAIDRRRQVARAADTPLAPPAEIADPRPDPLSAALSADERRRLAACLDTLEAIDRRFVATAFLEGSTYPELADRAAMPLATVKSRIRRALLKLRGCMG